MLIVQTESLWWEMTTYKEIILSPINFYTLIKNCVPWSELISKRRMLSMLSSLTKHLCWFSFRIDIVVSCSEKFPQSCFVQCVETIQVGFMLDPFTCPFPGRKIHFLGAIQLNIIETSVSGWGEPNLGLCRMYPLVLHQIYQHNWNSGGQLMCNRYVTDMFHARWAGITDRRHCVIV